VRSSSAAGRVGLSELIRHTPAKPAASRSSVAPSSRSPRSAPRCRSMPNRCGSRPSKADSSPAGVYTAMPQPPTSAGTESTVETTSAMKQRDSCAASAGVSGGHSRVLLAPLIGALHMIPRATRLGSGASIANNAPTLPVPPRPWMKRTWRLRDAAARWSQASAPSCFRAQTHRFDTRAPKARGRECQHAYGEVGERLRADFHLDPGKHIFQ
jgi:hypothetical protein